MNIFVGNLNYKVTEEELNDVFQEYGTVDSVKIITDRMSGRSKGFGFIEMPGEEEGERAIAELHEGELMGRKLIVNKARPRD